MGVIPTQDTTSSAQATQTKQTTKQQTTRTKQAAAASQQQQVSSKEAMAQLAAVRKLEGILAKHRVTVLSKTWCGYCGRVKEVMSQYPEADVHYVELDVEPDGRELQIAAMQLTGQRTVPNVFIDQKSIGGADDTVRLHRAGDLGALLAGSQMG